MAASRFATSRSPTGWPMCAPSVGRGRRCSSSNPNATAPRTSATRRCRRARSTALATRRFCTTAPRATATHPRGHAALEETLLDAVQWMRRNQGVAKIGPGRAAVKEALEAKLAAGQRLISHQGYLDLCAEVERTGQGRISDTATAARLPAQHRHGVLSRGPVRRSDHSRPGMGARCRLRRVRPRLADLPEDRAQPWPLPPLGLAEWVWRQHGAPEQELFLSFMQQCGICFTIQRGGPERRIEAEYIAPDLLPRVPTTRPKSG